MCENSDGCLVAWGLCECMLIRSFAVCLLAFTLDYTTNKLMLQSLWLRGLVVPRPRWLVWLPVRCLWGRWHVWWHSWVVTAACTSTCV